MAFVGPPFVHDLFISYSHGGDDGAGNGYLQPWSAAFARELERELRADRKFRQDLRVFLDRDLRPGQGVDPLAALTDQLNDQIKVSALLVVLMSPDYLASPWCTDEREWWFSSQAAHGLSTDERVAVVKVWPTEVPWPPTLTDSRGEPLPGFTFHEKSEGTDRPIGWVETPGPFGTSFRKAILNIAGRLYPKLEAIKARLAEMERSKADIAKLAQPSGQSLYLHGRADQGAAWERAALQLTQNGFAVVPGEPDPVEGDVRRLQTIRERRVETLSACDALLLLATEDGRALDSDLVVVGKYDRQSARARSNHLLPCGVLNTVGDALTTPVRVATARLVQADWIDGTAPAWPPAVQQWLSDKSGAETL